MSEVEEQFVPVLNFDLGAAIRSAHETLAAAKVGLKDATKAFYNAGAIEAFRGAVKEATGGKAREQFFFKALSDGVECSFLIKGNTVIDDSGLVTATAYFWTGEYTIPLSNITGLFASVEEADAFYAIEEEAYNAQQEADRLAAEEFQKQREQEKLDRAADRQRKADEKRAERELAKNAGNGAPESTPPLPV